MDVDVLACSGGELSIAEEYWLDVPEEGPLIENAALRKHFRETICRVADDPEEVPPISAEGVELETPHWADPRLISDRAELVTAQLPTCLRHRPA